MNVRRLLQLGVLSAMLWTPAVAVAQQPEDQPADAPAARPGGPGRAGRLGRPPVPPNPETMTVAQVEQYVDQVELYQAQTTLKLADSQFFSFGAGLRRLQMSRRQGQRQRALILRDINQLLNAAPLDEAAVSGKLKELEDLNASVNQQVVDAYAAIDKVLDLPQRARFRVFEEMMERRKLDLLVRARQAAAGR